jgi:hypothetical protein
VPTQAQLRRLSLQRAALAVPAVVSPRPPTAQAPLLEGTPAGRRCQDFLYEVPISPPSVLSTVQLLHARA